MASRLCQREAQVTPESVGEVSTESRKGGAAGAPGSQGPKLGAQVSESQEGNVKPVF